MVSTLEQMQVPKWDRTRCPEEISVVLAALTEKGQNIERPLYVYKLLRGWLIYYIRGTNKWYKWIEIGGSVKRYSKHCIKSQKNNRSSHHTVRYPMPWMHSGWNLKPPKRRFRAVPYTRTTVEYRTIVVCTS